MAQKLYQFNMFFWGVSESEMAKIVEKLLINDGIWKFPLDGVIVFKMADKLSCKKPYKEDVRFLNSLLFLKSSHLKLF